MDQNKTGSGPDGEDAGRLDRPLGRGLEDISHLFLSTRSSEAAAHGPPSGSAPPRPTFQRGSRGGPVVLGRKTSLTRDQLAPLLREFQGALEEGLTSIDARIPCPPYGEIDLLALSRSNQLTIVDFDTKADESLLLRGISHVDWVTRSMPIVRRMYPGHTINDTLPPALVLVAPQFPPALRSAARQIAGPTISWVRYAAMESSGGLGIFFEPMEGE